MKDYWTNLNGRQKQGERERFNFLMNLIENSGGSTGTVKDYDSDIGELNDKIAGLESTVEELTSTISELQSTIEELSGKIAESPEELDEL